MKKNIYCVLQIENVMSIENIELWSQKLKNFSMFTIWSWCVIGFSNLRNSSH